ncbi:MAG: hypothetical protein ACRD94_02945 [Nitrosopumilaceae archaeon]
MKQGHALQILGKSCTVNPRIFILLASFMPILFFSLPAFAQNEQTKDDYQFTTVIGEELKKNPTAIKILENIEIAKKRFAEMQNAEKQKTDQEKFIEEQRRIAKEILEKDLARMNKDYEDFTPRNAFSKFVTGINATHNAIFWDQFNYMDEKIKIAKQAKKAVLDGGGTYTQAQAEYVKYASMSRGNMIKYVAELNIKYGFTDEMLQSYFDKDGKLPRYDNDEFAPCYACEKYEQIREEMLAEQQLAKQNNS